MPSVEPPALRSALGLVGDAALIDPCDDGNTVMKYGLTRMILGSPGSVLLSHTEYQTIESAMNGLLEYTSIEEKFDLVREKMLAGGVHYEFP